MGLRHAGLPPARAAADPGGLRRAGAVALLGLVGVAGLLLQPLPPDLAQRVPAMAGAPPAVGRALLVLNPALLVLALAVVGALTAHRVGLRSLAAGTADTAGRAAWRAWARTLARCSVAGLALGAGLAAADAWLRPHLGPAWQQLAAGGGPGGAARLGAMLYGGLAEEVMLRWGVMSLVAWALVAWSGRRGRRWPMAVAIVVAAALFAAGHLPALAAQVELTPLLVARTLWLNGVAGLLCGWLFWRHHLEAAMAAHAAMHLGLWAWSLLPA